MRNLMTDEEIIELYNKGDQELFKELIGRYTSSIFNFSAYLVGKYNAPDVTQETFIKTWKNLSDFDSEKASFKTWVFTIAKNTAIDFLKKKKSILFSEMSTDDDFDFSETVVDDNPLPDETLERLEDEEAIRSLLQELPPHFRTVLILHYQEDLTFSEIGRILDKPLNTVKSYHHRALLELRKMI